MAGTPASPKVAAATATTTTPEPAVEADGTPAAVEPTVAEEPAPSTMTAAPAASFGFANSAICKTLDLTSIAMLFPNYRLPGGAPDPRNTLTGAQYNMIAMFAQTNYPMESWENGCGKLRIAAKVRLNKPNPDFDFKICGWISDTWEAERAGDELTFAQKTQYVKPCREALAGTAPHFDDNIQAAIEACDPEIRKIILIDWIKIRNQGDFSRARTVFEEIFGRLTPRASRAAMPDASGVYSVGDPSLSVPAEDASGY